MRVDPTGSQSPVTRPSSGPTARPTAGSTDPAAAGTAADPGAFAMTDQLAALLAAVRQVADVRAEVVQAALAKMNSGELSTPAAAADTAQAMLADGNPAGN